MNSSPPTQSLPYILKNKGLVEAHIEKHRQSWDPAASDPRVNDSEAFTNISVFVRIRPLLPHDIQQDSYSLAAVQHPRTVHFTHPTLRWAGARFSTKTYESDGAFDELDDSKTVYQTTGLATSLEQCIAVPGKELYVLAYGQTGTGKTYTTTYIEETMVNDLFSKINCSGRQVTIHSSIFEIRGSAAYDLLSSPPFAPVKITTTPSSNGHYPDLSEHSASSATDLLGLVRSAASLRFTRSTTKNDASSRSHSVVRFRLAFNGPNTNTPADADSPLSSNIFIVDLAGSERAAHSATNDDPERRKEAIETNKSLAVLKDCIRGRLSDNPNSTATVALWRGSKITTVLRRAFERSTRAYGSSGEEARVVVIACVSPSVLDCEDSLNTLNYVTPFRLAGRHAVDASDSGDRIPASKHSSEVEKWDHEQSVAYIKRNLPKFTPFIDQLLPAPDSTISSLLTLTQAEILALVSSPGPHESHAEAGAAQARLLAQAKSVLPSYCAKLQKLSAEAAKIGASDNQSGKVRARTMGSTNQSSLRGDAAVAASLKALSGKDFTANETGPVTKIPFFDSVP